MRFNIFAVLVILAAIFAGCDDDGGGGGLGTPTIEITSGPSGLVTEKYVTFSWQGTDTKVGIAHYFYGLNVVPNTYTENTSVTLGPLSSGDYTFSVIAVNKNAISSSSATRDFNVSVLENVLPTVQITDGPTDNTVDTTPTFTYSGTDNDGTISGYWVGIDTNPPTTWTTSTSWTSPALSLGNHTFYVVARDNEGGLSNASSLSFEVIYISNPPTVSIDSGPTGDTDDTTPTFTYSATDNDGTIAGYYVGIDTNPPTTATNSTSFTSSSLSPGSHTFYVYAVDDSGTESTVASRTFNVLAPNYPPTVSIVSGPNNTTTNPRPTFQYTGSDNDGYIAGYWVGFDGPPTEFMSSNETSYSPVSPLDNGIHTFYVRAQDDDGALSDCASRTFNYDSGGVSSNIPYELDFGTRDVIFDETRGFIYFTDYDGRRMVRVDASTGLIDDEAYFSHYPDSMSITPDGTRLFVCLRIKDEYPDEGTGWWKVVELQLDTFTKYFGYDIDFDPIDIVVTDAGRPVMSEAEGDDTTYKMIGYITLHPDQRQIYATGVNDDHIYKYLVRDIGSFAYSSTYYMGEDPYDKGTYRTTGKKFVHPDGHFLITGGGDVFTSSPVESYDMLYLKSLDNSRTITDLCFYEPNDLILAAEGNSVAFYNLQSAEKLSAHTITLDDETVKWTGVCDDKVFAIVNTGNSTYLRYYDWPMTFPTGGGNANTVPTPSLVTNPTDNVSIDEMIVFSAQGASDAEDNADDLLVRWDFNNDGLYDTSWTYNKNASYIYDSCGIKIIRLQVKDTLGAVGTSLYTMQIGPNDVENPYLFDPPANDSFSVFGHVGEVVVDDSTEYCYMTIPGLYKMVEVDLAGGQITREIDMNNATGIYADMESMCISPDGSTIYVAMLNGRHSEANDLGKGYIAVVDVTSFTLTRYFDTRGPLTLDNNGIDPIDIVATDAGIVIVTSGSGGLSPETTKIQAFDASTGAILGYTTASRNALMSLSADQSTVFVTDPSGINWPWDSNINAYLVNSGDISWSYDSPYEEYLAGEQEDDEARFGGKVWAEPGGSYVLSRGGDVFDTSDLNYVTSYGEYTTIDMAFDSTAGYAYSLQNNFLYMHDYATFAYVDRTNLGKLFSHLFVTASGNVYMLRRSLNGTDVICLTPK